jgi:hypothetical protein
MAAPGGAESVTVVPDAYVPVPGVSVGAVNVPKFIVYVRVLSALDVQPARKPIALTTIDVATDSVPL